MTTVRPDARAPHWLRSTLPGVAAVVITLLVLGLPSALAAPASTTPPSGETAMWDNGVVVCEFGTTAPSVTAEANGSTAAGMWVGLDSLTATSVAGLITETADLSATSWSVLNLSTATQYSLGYTTEVPVTTLLGLSLGTANVTVTFSLADSAFASSAQNRTVGIGLSVVGWPLDVLSSNMTAELSFRPANASAEHLAASTTGTTGIASVENATGATDAYLNASSTGVIESSGGILSTIPVVSAVLGLSVGSATLAVSFGAPATTASSVQYETALQVVSAETPRHSHLPLPGHLPTADFVAAAGAAVLVSLGLAGATRRVRRSPSDLEYVEEEP